MDTLLRRERTQRQLRPEDLARQLGVHPMSVLRWERRERLPGPAHLYPLATALELDPTRVIEFFDAARSRVAPPESVRGHGLRRLRQQAGIPAVTIAAELGVRASTVYNWEAGRARIPHPHLEPLARLLRLSTPDLVARLRAAPATRAPRPAPTTALGRIRRRSRLSIQQAAAAADVRRHALSEWERGLGTPPLAAARRLARAYGVPLAEVASAAGVRPPRLLDARQWQPGDFPEVLRCLRAWTGLTQRELAVRAGCSPESVRSWEAGRAAPRPPSLRRVEQAFGLAGHALDVTLGAPD
ncbi:helix-turn-helix transcriptional regulator [Nocardioides pelophilus]|uniref:helix-turn-helix transcriptional regulator n=1 Tax=Nocardioides pelophilus TaxID=2172019 RepID=UPI0016007A1D|nr:helix-turn-helix transcriptional regulator [Nocardioides pelophilus]